MVKPLKPDVSIVHSPRSDLEGNSQIWGIIREQKEATFAARRIIVTAEDIVPFETIKVDPNRTLIPGF
ncbi:MAG: CoA-transferase [Candidatus Micrarchaeia archaeon]